MSKLILFSSRKELSAHANLDAFIGFAKHQLPTWADIEDFNWDSAKWKTTSKTIRFVNEEHCSLHPSLQPLPDQLMEKSFCDIAKAYIRYRHHLKPHNNIAREVSAFRALEYVLRKEMSLPDITKVCQRHVDESAVTLGRHKAAPYIAAELIRILTTLSELGIVTTAARYWTHPYVQDRSYTRTRGGLAPQEVKDGKVAHQDALLAIGEIFSRGYNERQADADVLVTCLTALLLSAPMRIGEMVRLRNDCVGTDRDKNGDTQYYLRYWVPKIREYARKPIPKVMSESAIEAVNRLTKITAEGRRLARYMETQPTKFYRHSECPNVPDDQILTPAEVAQALGLINCVDFVRRLTGSRKLTGFTLNSLWQLVLKEHKRSNPYFPYQESHGATSVRPPKMSESLLCFRRSQFNREWTTSPVLLAPFNRDYYAKRLASDQSSNKRSMCFFAYHGFVSIILKSHGIRHLLNRIAKHSGISVDVITAWSSRTSVGQTYTYLDNDGGRAATLTGNLMGIQEEHSPKAPITNEEAGAFMDGPFHRSRYGLCRRSWRIGPCNKFGDCLNCSELVMCKGDRIAVKTIEADFINLNKTYAEAERAIALGEKSATRWVSLALPQINKMAQLLTILKDPAVVEGSPIVIEGANFSHEQTLMDSKVSEAKIKVIKRSDLTIEYGHNLLECLDDLRKI